MSKNTSLIYSNQKSSLLEKEFGIKLSIFVPGSVDGFPCEINLSEELNSSGCGSTDEKTKHLIARLTGSQVCNDLDQALIYAEVSSSNLLQETYGRSFLTSTHTAHTLLS